MFAKYHRHILLHLIILVWGFTGILGVVIQMDSLSIVWYRVLIAAISLFIGMLFLKKSFRVPSRKRLFQICLIGVVVGLHWITFFQAIKLSTASFGVLCLSTTTLHVAWLEPLVMKRKFSWVELVLSLFIVYGIYFVSSDFKSGDDFMALLYGLSSAVFAAVFAVFNAKFAMDTPPSTISFYEMVVASIFLTILLLCIGRIDANLFDIRLQDFFWLLFLGVICTSFAFLATIEIVKHLGAFTVSLSINLEPVYAILFGIFYLNENKVLDADFYVGAVIIIGVIFLNAGLKAVLKKRQERQLSKKS